ncbi:MAG: UDP-3-O-(3-hydroxymyristoyl)glucosamine N-acyltransferase [Deltaproteobacteria bacterium]|nr:UDP-3-O-(3-hydroxymyristoyl)glucosamine N-acyltransferase [Deltaproteobacteria bacterium]
MEITIFQLAEKIGAKAGQGHKTILRTAAPFDQAGPDAVTFADNTRLLKLIGQSRAGAVIVPLGFINEPDDSGPGILLSDNPRLAFASAIRLFFPDNRPAPGIRAKAFVGRGFSCGKDVFIGPNAVVGEKVTLGDRVCIHAGVVIGDNVVIGDDTLIYPNVSVLDRCVIGKRVIIHSGSVIGSDGFGFTPDSEGRHNKIPQVGIVRIDDDVEIGASNTIDRATFGETRIGEGTKTDNHVHIAHNVIIGKHCIIVAQVGIAGSVTIGSHVIIAGQAGIGGHLSIGDGAVIGPQAGVARSVGPGLTVSGTPEMPHKKWLRVQNLVARLPEIKKSVSSLDQRLKEIEARLDIESKDDGK